MKILVPTDFSELSLKAIKVAGKYASIFDGSISLMHSHIPITELDEPYAIGMSSKIYQDYEEIEESIKKKLNSISDEHVDKAHKGDMQVHIGNPAQSIVEVAEDFDIIIMSTHGRTGFSRFLLGSVAEKVLRMSKIPVMVVENESEVDDFKKILVTTDFSENAVAAYPKALELAKKTGGTVDILHILSFDQFEDDETDPSIKKIREQRMKLIEKEYFHEIGDRVKSYTLVSEDSPHVAIQKYTKSTPYNIIVMSTIGKTGINYLMMGSTTANVVRHVKTAVLSVRPEPKE
jgi:nucleotide-binding universal stress UspA family protein